MSEVPKKWQPARSDSGGSIWFAGALVILQPSCNSFSLLPKATQHLKKLHLVHNFSGTPRRNV